MKERSTRSKAVVKGEEKLTLLLKFLEVMNSVSLSEMFNWTALTEELDFALNVNLFTKDRIFYLMEKQ